MGETAKKSGEIGEALASALLERIGWAPLMKNVSIGCNTPTHLNEEGNPRRTHGEDQIFVYHSRFHDDRTDVVHVSNKNILGKYPKAGTLKSQFKGHIAELLQTIECAKYDPKIREITNQFRTKKDLSHSGLLIWLQNDRDDIEKDIKEELENVRLEGDSTDPVYLVDNERASFLLKAVDDLVKRATKGSFEFFYPRIGTALSVEENRTGNLIPLELIVSDIIPAVIRSNDSQEMIIYANVEFDSDSYAKLISYGLNFATGLVKTIRIGMKNFNPARDQEEASRVRLIFHHRVETIIPFSFDRTILDLLQEQK